MAGIGIKLNKFFDKGTVTGYLAGSGYSVVTTIAPMLLVIADILAMQKILGYSDAAYGSRQLFQATFLYIFVFLFFNVLPLYFYHFLKLFGPKSVQKEPSLLDIFQNILKILW